MPLFLIYILIVLSGFTGLLYQVVWQKYLAILLGSSASATALVLSGFFIFLSLGYSFFARILPRFKQSRILIYAFIELGIGFYALLSPDLFAWLKDFYWQSGLIDQPLASGILLVFALLAIPTLLMGGTIPVLSEGLSGSFTKSHAVHARIYGLNTLGGFLGAFATTFILIEHFGLPVCLLIGGALNILISLGGWVVAKKTTSTFLPPEDDMGGLPLSRQQRGLIYLASFLSGFYVFSLENIIIRMSSMAIGSTIYSYGMVVSAFIVSIAIGSHLAEKTDTFKKPTRLSQIQWGLFLSCIGLYFLIPLWPDLFYRLRAMINPFAANFSIYNQLIFLTMTLLLVLPVSLMGMSLPLLFGYMRGRQFNISAVIGRLYAFNSIGAMLGALIGGYVLFYYLRADQIFKVNLVLVIISIIIFNYLISVGGAKRLLPLIGFLILLLPTWPTNNFLPARTYLPINVSNNSFSDYLKQILGPGMEILFEQEDPELHVAVAKFSTRGNDGVTHDEVGLYLNGKADANFPGDEVVRAMLPLYSSIIAPTTTQTAIIGLGAGTSLAIVANLQTTKNVDVIEISPAVVQALPYFYSFNPGLKENLSKVHFHVGDAFQKIRQQNHLYNLILCEPTNLWIPAVEKLYTSDFFSLVADKLSDDGVFALWVPIGALNQSTTSLIISTLNKVFPYVSIWNSGFGTISLIATKHLQHLLPDDLLLSRFNDNRAFYDRLKVESYQTLLAGQIATPWTAQVLSHTDGRLNIAEYPIISFSAARSRFAEESTNYDKLLNERIIRSGPKDEPSNQFLFQPESTNTTPAILSDITSFYKRIGNMTSQLFELKWNYFNDKLTKSTATRSSAVANLSYLIDGWANSSKKFNPSQQMANMLLHSYRQARVIGLTPSVQPILDSIDWTCENYECGLVALELLHELLNPTEAANLRKSKPDLFSLASRQIIIRQLKKVKDQQQF